MLERSLTNATTSTTMSSRPGTAMSLLGEGRRAKQPRSLLSRLRTSSFLEAGSSSASSNLGAMMVGGAFTAPPVRMPATSFRCDVYGSDGSDFINAIEECEQLVQEQGGRVVQEYAGGFVYDMKHPRNKNPLNDQEPTERGGYINISAWDSKKKASYRPPVPPKSQRTESSVENQLKPETRTTSTTKEKAGKLLARIKQRVVNRRQPQQTPEQQLEGLAVTATDQPVDMPLERSALQRHEEATDAASDAVSACTQEPDTATITDTDLNTYISPRHCRNHSDAGSEASIAASDITRGSINSSNYDWESAVIETAQWGMMVPAGLVRLVDIPPRRFPQQ